MKTNRFTGIFRLFIVLSIIALLAGCSGGGGGGGDETPTPGPTPELTYDLSGTITSGSVALPGVTITLSGTGSGKIAVTDASGNYTFTELTNGSYTITPTLAGYGFNQVSQAVTIIGANVTAINFTATANSDTTYSISGTVTSGGVSLSGVTMTLSGASSGIKTTDSSGKYSFTGLANGSYTITPMLSGYVFNQVSQVVTVNGANTININFTATATNPGTTYSISGTIVGEILQGVTIALSGTSSRTATTNASGNYSLTGLTNGSYTITPSLSGYVFTPVNRTVTINGTNATVPSFTASSSTNPPVDPPIPPVGQPKLSVEQAQDALYAVYGGIGYNDRLNTGDDALLYRIMVSNMNSIGIDLILKTVLGDPNYATKLLSLTLTTPSVEFKSKGTGYTSTLTIKRDTPRNGYYPFNATLNVAFDGTGAYAYNTCKVYGPGNNTDLTAYFTGHFGISNNLAIIIRTVKVTSGNGTWTVEDGVTTSYNNWELAYNVNYGADDPMGGFGAPTNLEFIPSSYNTISTQTYPDLRDYTVGGSFVISGKKYSFAGFRYEQEQIDTYVMMSANGQMSVPGLASNFLVSSTLNTSNPGTNYTIITHVFEHSAWSSAWRSGILILGDTSAVFDNGSVTFTGGAGSWIVPDWKTALSIP